MSFPIADISAYFNRRTTMDGTVKKIVRDKGFGFIKAFDGSEWFFHRTGVEPRGTFDTLNEGDTVSFEGENSPKGPRASSVRVY